MKQMPQVVVIASFVSEMIFRVGHLMQPGETLTGRFSEGLGGKGFNMSIAARRCGAEVYPVLKLGADARAAKPLEYLTAEGIDTRHATSTEGSPSGIGIILIGDDGQNSIAVDAGANAELGSTEIHAAADLIRGAGAVLAQLETPPIAALEAFRIARAAGVTTILNPAPAPETPLPRELLALTDIITPNESEAAALTGGSAGKTWQETALKLHAMGPLSVAMTLGSHGAGLLHCGEFIGIPATEVIAIDTSGAGDAFNGALACRLASGAPLEAACRFAVKYASLQVTRRGTSVAMPHAIEF